MKVPDYLESHPIATGKRELFDFVFPYANLASYIPHVCILKNCLAIAENEVMTGIYINEKLTIPEEELQWSFARSSGPGGQNVNKVNSKATMRWTPSPGRMTRAVWNRFKILAKRYVTSEGEVVIQSQEHRDQPQNVEACRVRLKLLVRQALVVPKRRIKTKPSRSSQRRRLDEKKRHSAKKQSRRSKDW